MQITNTAKPPPVIDFGAFYGGDSIAKQDLVDQIREACLEKGFFQITNHHVPRILQDGIFQQSKEFFDMNLADKMKVDKVNNPYNRGYETLRAQDFEKTGKGDLKEGYYFGADLPVTHPSVTSRKFNMGPNLYPDNVPDPEQFKNTIESYFEAMCKLAQNLLQVLALSLSLPETYFADSGFCNDPIATLRLLHYPPQPQSDGQSNEKPAEPERGIGAHTDFGAITLLLQDSIGGLQVYDTPTDTWLDVIPVPDAMVINLGNLMMRWSNDQYISNLHRVINKNTNQRHRYSVPFFFAGNPDFVVECLPTCESEAGQKYSPIRVEDWMKGRYADTYVNGKKEDAMQDLKADVMARANAIAA